MSMRPQEIPEIPKDTFDVAQAAFFSGNLYIQMRKQLGIVYNDHDFVALFSEQGQPAESPRRLVLGIGYVAMLLNVGFHASTQPTASDRTSPV